MGWIGKKRCYKGLVTGIGVLSLTGCNLQQERVNTPPNVIYIFPDQLRNQALGFWNEEGFKEEVSFRGDPTYTPHLNKLAKESVVLTSAMSNFPLSSPHRGMLLTGMYPHRSGVPLNCNSNRPLSSLSEDAVCVSDVFSEAGYDCGYFGKLHAEFPTPNDPENPGQYVEDSTPVWDAYTPKARRHGFNYWYSYGTYDVHKSPHYWDNEGKRHQINEWSPIHEAKEVISYLKNERGQRTSGKPFFVMVAMNPPHSPYQGLDDCMEEDYNLYKDIPIDSLLIRPNANVMMDKARCAPYYFASVTGIDRACGMIFETLKELHLEQNTIVIFASDHGETMCSQSTNDPKNSPYSESMNIPFMVRYPGHIKPRVDDLLLSSPDIMPTLLGLAGLENAIPGEVQGNNYSSLFIHKDDTLISRPTSALYFQNADGLKDENGIVQSYFPKGRGIKTHTHTLAIYIDRENRQPTQILFFDDINDPYQMDNLNKEEYPEEFASLCKEMGKELKRIEDPWYTERILDELMLY